MSEHWKGMRVISTEEALAEYERQDVHVLYHDGSERLINSVTDIEKLRCIILNLE